MRSKLGMDSCFSKCGPLSSSISFTWEPLERQILGPISDQLNQGLYAREGLRSQEEGRLRGLLIPDSWLARQTGCPLIPMIIWKVDTILLHR